MARCGKSFPHAFNVGKFLKVTYQSQHDLRTHHVCDRARSTCGPPLASYAEQSVKLYSLSVSRARPDVFVVAGTSPYAFLHDRRMQRSSMRDQWQVEMKDGLATQCVRRFGLPPRTEEKEGENGKKGKRRWEAEMQVTACKLSESNGRDVSFLNHVENYNRVEPFDPVDRFLFKRFSLPVRYSGRSF